MDLQTGNLSRRSFLKKAGGTAAITAGGLSLAACGPSSGNKVTLRMWDDYVTQGPWMENEIQLFQKAHPDITIKRTTYDYSKYPNLLGLAQKSNTAPDVFMMIPPTGITFDDMVKQNWLLPLSDFSDYNAFKSSFPDPALNFVVDSNISRTTNKTYSAPFGGNEPNIELWVNTKVFKDAGLVDSAGNVQVPHTLDEMLAASRVIKQKSGGSVYGYGFGSKLPYQDIWLIDLVTNLSSNGSISGQNFHTGKYDFADNPVFNKAINWLQTMKSEGHVLPASSSVDDEGIRFLFSQHKFGMLLAGIWVIQGWQQTSPNFTEYTMDYAPLIGTDQPNGSYYVGPGGTNFAINGRTKQKDAAWTWLKWLYSEAAGERWVKAGNGTSIFPNANKPEYAQNEAQRNFFNLCKTMVKISPQPNLRNPGVGKLNVATVTPSESDIVQGAFTGQITDVAGALRKLQQAKQQALETAINDANSAGAHVSLSDFIFPDWNPLQDYTTKPAS